LKITIDLELDLSSKYGRFFSKGFFKFENAFRKYGGEGKSLARVFSLILEIVANEKKLATSKKKPF